MPGTYDDPLVISYGAQANACLSTTAVAERFIGPLGMKGRILAAEVIVTTATTDAASALQVGPAGGVATANLDMSIPIASQHAGHVATAAELAAGATLAADTVHEISGDGGATAGAADITVTVGWFK